MSIGPFGMRDMQRPEVNNCYDIYEFFIQKFSKFPQSMPFNFLSRRKIKHV